MNSVINQPLENLQPASVWQWFAKICAIPHPTFHEKQLGDFILQQANLHADTYGLKAEMDAKGNIRIRKPASKDMLDHAPVIIQAHYDMVAQKANTSSHDFTKDAIKPIVKEGWVWADDTTLGADNGLGLAMALAVVFSDDIAHPPLTLILTSEEEIGMGGVQALNPQWLTAPFLINLDSEDEGALFVGCAGGRDATFHYQFDVIDHQTIHNQDLDYLEISVSGLHGGHSGIDIHKGYANANLILARILSSIYQHSPFYLSMMDGGVLRNVITRDAKAVIFGNKTLMEAVINDEMQLIKKELAEIEPNLLVNFNVADTQDSSNPMIGLADTQRLIDIIRCIPNGVIRMSDSFTGTVESSISMGVVNLNKGEFHVKCLMRSLSESPKDDISQTLLSLARLTGIQLVLSDDYPGWTPAPNSYLLNKTKPIMQQVFGKEPAVEVIHAGLECGILSGKAPQLDMVSFGPNIRAAHSPQERVEIASVAKTWQVLLALLQQLPITN